MEADEHIHRKRGWVAIIVTLLVLGLFGAFALRVVHYAELIRSGDIDSSSLNFAESFSTNLSLASKPIIEGAFDLTTSDDPRLGSSSARVKIVEFADFGCPYSREASFVLRELAVKYPEFVQFIYRDFPITDLHPNAQKSAEAGECADEQGKFWEYHDKLYQNQNQMTEGSYVEFAEGLNMNVAQFESCLLSGRHTQEVLEDYQAGVDAGVRGTPTFFINGNRVPGSIPLEILDAVIQSVLNQEE